MTRVLHILLHILRHMSSMVRHTLLHMPYAKNMCGRYPYSTSTLCFVFNGLHCFGRCILHILLHIGDRRNAHKIYFARVRHILLHISSRVLHPYSTEAQTHPPTPRRGGRGCIHTPSFWGFGWSPA